MLLCHTTTPNADAWTQSTDDFDAQANIRYDVYVNGRFEDVAFGSGGPRVIPLVIPQRLALHQIPLITQPQAQQ